MSQQRPPGVKWESWVERQIRAAQEAGAFDNLSGLGQPISDIDGRVDEELWWVKSLLRREQLSIVPPSLEIRRVVEQELSRTWALSDEVAVRRAVAELNERIRQAHYAITWGPASSVMPLEADEVVAEWRRRRGPPVDDSPLTRR
jgi:hypothetical protein